jgi:hypothetical protein
MNTISYLIGARNNPLAYIERKTPRVDGTLPYSYRLYLNLHDGRAMKFADICSNQIRRDFMRMKDNVRDLDTLLGMAYYKPEDVYRLLREDAVEEHWHNDAKSIQNSGKKPLELSLKYINEKQFKPEIIVGSVGCNIPACNHEKQLSLIHERADFLNSYLGNTVLYFVIGHPSYRGPFRLKAAIGTKAGSNNGKDFENYYTRFCNDLYMWHLGKESQREYNVSRAIN